MYVTIIWFLAIHWLDESTQVECLRSSMANTDPLVSPAIEDDKRCITFDGLHPCLLEM